MDLKYFKKHWNETTGEELTDSWGHSIYFFETDFNLTVIRQIQLFQNGKSLKYDDENLQDDYGALSDQPLESEEFIDNEISKTEFYEIWNNGNPDFTKY
ncbi:hypothetical protein [Epilithonimonas hispanica]|uniref:Uncharacterized protein n=1 Tax=Epilithonimonas hispanica TaxID=358687 RepID=A0A3D9CZ28_9FLAO|nr:hypothetical protein [Epilithonimonas hispanica]REC70898.1 hypothetical protein DRF58_07930 [Epilithonimonas hispanica]